MRKLLNKRKKRTKVFIIMGLFVILFVGIGYSYLKETLTINSNTEISSMKWDVHLENVKVTTGSIVAVNDPKIGIDKLSVTTSLDFTQPKQFYEYTVDVKNDGSIDAMIDSYDSTVLTEAQSKYLIYTATYSDGERVQNNQILKAGEKETIRVRIEVKEDLQKSDLPTDGDEIKITFKLNYVQADSDATDRYDSTITYVTRQVEGEITPGDVIKIGDTEEFYVISSNSNSTVLLAKNNLLVGLECSENTGFENKYLSSSNTEGYGLQSAYATGFNDLTTEQIAIVAFSSTNYWDNNGLISPYNANGASYSGNPYPNVYNNSYVTEPDFANDGFNTSGYSIAYYVEQYKAKLIEMGAPLSISARLLTYEEANNAKNVKDNGESIILNVPSFWLGSARGFGNVWYADSVYTALDGDQYNRVYNSGVRPVIEISNGYIK